MEPVHWPLGTTSSGASYQTLEKGSPATIEYKRLIKSGLVELHMQKLL